MTADDFRRIALSFEGAEPGSHFGARDFRVGGHIFATLAAERQGYGNLVLDREQQAAFLEEYPELFLPVTGMWGRAGYTHIRLASATEHIAWAALKSAYDRRVAKNNKPKATKPRKQF